MKKNSLMRNTTAPIKRNVPVVAIILFSVTALQSCEKQETSASESIQATTSQASASTSPVSKQQALTRLNAYFKNEFSPISMQQVTGVTKQQFTNWLTNSYMAPAKDLYLKPALSGNGNEYVIIKNVIVKETGKLASVGLIAVTPQFFGQYTRMVAVVNYNNVVLGIKHICSWKKCDSYEPCPCINWIDIVTGDCPTDRCIVDEDCAHFSATDCDGQLTGIKTIDVIAAF
jgi:hypothetical protein